MLLRVILRSTRFKSSKVPLLSGSRSRSPSLHFSSNNTSPSILLYSYQTDPLLHTSSILLQHPSPPTTTMLLFNILLCFGLTVTSLAIFCPTTHRGYCCNTINSDTSNGICKSFLMVTTSTSIVLIWGNRYDYVAHRPTWCC